MKLFLKQTLKVTEFSAEMIEPSTKKEGRRKKLKVQEGRKEGQKEGHKEGRTKKEGHKEGLP